jgi:hypothetical protein
MSKTAPKEDIQIVPGWNEFFAIAASSVVVDEELCKHNAGTSGSGMGPKQPYETLSWSRKSVATTHFLSKMLKI